MTTVTPPPAPTCPQGVCACGAELPHGLAGVLALVLDARDSLLTQYVATAVGRTKRRAALSDALDDLESVAFWLRCQLGSPATTERLEVAA